MRALLLFCSLLLVGCGATLVDHLDLNAAPPQPAGCPENVNACGPTCGACPAAPVNGTASCEKAACVSDCSPPYLKCSDSSGAPSCCLANAVAAGGHTTCALVDNGTVRCWGAPLGSSALPSPVPASVDGLTSVIAVEVGSSHACAIVPGGSVRCWGDNLSGQLGQSEPARSATPLDPVPGVSGATELSLGERHSCARTPSGVVCWGANELGQLGDGTQNPRADAVIIVGTAGAGAIAAGLNHNCAVLASGGVSCWGAGDRGQLGNGTVLPQPTPAPVKFSGGSAAAHAVAAGEHHSCALFSSSLACWGQNDFGQLGNGSSSGQDTPRQVSLANPSAVAAGRAHTCAAAGSGGQQLYCWGANNFGQLGTGDAIPHPLPSTNPSPLLQVQFLASGTDHACALETSHALRCWGRNDKGQTGAASTAVSLSSPTLVTGR